MKRPSPVVPTLLLAAVAASTALIAPPVLAQMAGDDAAPATRPAGTADAAFDKVRSATDLPSALAAAKEFVTAYPDDQRSMQLMMALAANTSDADETKMYYEMLIEHHPTSPYAEAAKGQLAQAASIGQPLELTFTPLGSEEELSVQEDLKGKVVVLDFWATWCGPCIADLPEMMEIYEEYHEQGVEFIGVSLDAPEAEGGKKALEAFVAEREIPWPQYYQGNGWESEFSKSWGINSIPALFVIDADGKLHSTQARGQLQEMLPKLIAERDAQASAQ